ncbi:putative cytochrome P450 [Rhodococcoides trifolii]|uniref:Cytochrome P450 n=1 Tax=Rhodococcoides trifolii TaxID=908250 RepID=A0A917LED0_9NOCA|nr:cytochrome P450 [Rhodococcus trifolii]GGG16556.1 putative cytochrome P450 [Rhodococcus trifolii]
MTTSTPTFPIDFSDPEFLTGDRTESYRRLRHMGTIPWPHQESTWVVSRHEDIRDIVRLTSTRVQPEGTTAPPWMDAGPARDRLRANLVQVDEPDHSRLRNVVGPLFIPRRVAQFREIAAESVARALTRVPDGHAIDAVHELAVDIPRGVICHFLGIPEDDWGRLTENQHEFLQIFSPVPLDDQGKKSLDAITRFYLDYFEEFLDSRPTEQHSPYVRLLLEAQARGDLSRTEVLSLTHTILDAGYETTRTSISNIVEILATHPGVFDALEADPSLADSATEEFLRFRTPLHVRERYLTEPFTTSDGIELPVGAHVILMLAAANRDEAAFDNPDSIDLGRHNAGQHQAFGGGLHHCLGAPIARIQIQETLKGLASHFDRIEQVEPGVRFPDLIFPALTSLPVVMRRSGVS